MTQSTVPRPKQVLRDSCITWNRCLDVVPGWPQSRLTVPDNRRVYARPLTDFTAGFQSDVGAFLASLAKGELFGEMPREPASPSTVRGRRIQILEMATALVRTGNPIDTILSLKVLVDVTSVKQILTFHWERKGQRKTGQLHNFARTLVNIAKNWVRIPEFALQQLRQRCKQVNPGKSGMTEKSCGSKSPTGAACPSRNGPRREPGPLGTKVKAMIRKELGLTLNIHAFRHLCASLYLKAHPGDYETVRLLLGHKSIATTTSFYCGLEKGDAFRRYDALLDGYLQSTGRSDAA